jgi:radical SAM-linked protein
MRFLSHLDMVKAWQLLVERAGLPVAYSRGFHPVAQLQYSPPLAVGYAGMAEMVDLFLREHVPPEDVEANLEQIAPEGMRFFALVEVDLSAPALDRTIEAADYEMALSDAFEERHSLSGEAIRQRWRISRRSAPRESEGDSETEERVHAAAIQIASLEVDPAKPAVLRMKVARHQGNLADPRRLLERLLGVEIRAGKDAEVTRLGLVATAPRPGVVSPWKK